MEKSVALMVIVEVFMMMWILDYHCRRLVDHDRCLVVTTSRRSSVGRVRHSENRIGRGKLRENSVLTTGSRELYTAEGRTPYLNKQGESERVDCV